MMQANISDVPPNVPFISLRSEEGFQDRVLARWQEALQHTRFVSSSANAELTQLMLDYTGARHFVPCANGTDAIQIALRAHGIGIGDLVLVPDFTFWASYEAIINVGAKAAIVDIHPRDFQMDFDLCCQAVEQLPVKAVLLVHLYGWCSAQLADFRQLCKQKNIALIEDAAQTMGTQYQGQSIFAEADCATVSFYPAKALGAAGDAGGIFCKDAKIAERCLSLANHGRSSHYGHQYVGWSSRMDELQAHFLCESIPLFEQRLQSRRNSEQYYFDFVAKLSPERQSSLAIELQSPPTAEICSNAYLQVSLAKDSFAKLQEPFKHKGITIGNTYPSAVSEQLGIQEPLLFFGADRIAKQLAPRIVNLPLFPYMKETELEQVCQALVQVSDSL